MFEFEGEHQLVLLEAFVMALPEGEMSEPPSKRRKSEAKGKCNNFVEPIQKRYYVNC